MYIINELGAFDSVRMSTHITKGASLLRILYHKSENR